MSGMLSKLEGMMGGMGGKSNNNNNNNNNNMDPNSNSGMGNNQGGSMGGNMGNDRYESAIQGGEGYVKSHYSNDANLMRGEQMVEKVDQYRMGRNNMGNMQGGVGGMMSSDPNVSAQNPQAGNMGGQQQGGMGSDFSQQGGTDSSFNQDQSNYGTDGGMGPNTGMQQGGGMQQDGGMQQGGMQGGMQDDTDNQNY